MFMEDGCSTIKQFIGIQYLINDLIVSDRFVSFLSMRRLVAWPYAKAPQTYMI